MEFKAFSRSRQIKTPEQRLRDVAVREPAGKASDRLRVRQTVTAALPVRTYQATLTQLDQPFTLSVERPADALPGRGGVAIALRARLGDGLSGVTDYMAQYPYACLEQLVSVAVALRNRDRWEAVMKHLSDYQDEDGPLLHTSSNRRTSNL